jgi:predicted ATPase
MFIEQIEISGFKSISDSSIELNSLTLLCGENSSGKSSLIDVLLLTAQTFASDSQRIEPTFNSNGNIINIRSLKEIVSKNNFDPDEPISIRYIVSFEDHSIGEFSFKLQTDKNIGEDNVSELKFKTISPRIKEDISTFMEKTISTKNIQDFQNLELNLSNEQIDRIEKKEDLLDYVAGYKFIKESGDVNISGMRYSESGIKIKKLGTPSPWTISNYKSNMYELKEDLNIPPQYVGSGDPYNPNKEMLLAYLKKDVDLKNECNLLKHEEYNFKGTIFKSGIPTGFLREQIIVYDDLEAIREDISNKDKVDVESIAEVLIDRRIDLHEMDSALSQSDNGIPFDENEVQSWYEKKGYHLTADHRQTEFDSSIYYDKPPANSGKPWTKKEEKKLLETWFNGDENFEYLKSSAYEAYEHPLNSWMPSYILPTSPPLSLSRISELFQRDSIEVGKKLIDLGIDYQQVVTEYFYILNAKFFIDTILTPEVDIKTFMVEETIKYESDFVGKRELPLGFVFWSNILYGLQKESDDIPQNFDIENAVKLILKFINKHFDYRKFTLDKDHKYVLQDIVGGVLEACDFSIDEIEEFNDAVEDISLNTLRDDYKYMEFTPKDVALVTGKDPKTIRARLRKDYPRTSEEASSTWKLDPEVFFKLVGNWVDKSMVKEDTVLSMGRTYIQALNAYEHDKDRYRAPELGFALEESDESKESQNIVGNFRNIFNKVKYLGPLRERSPSNIFNQNFTSSPTMPLGRSGEHFVNYFHEMQQKEVYRLFPERHEGGEFMEGLGTLKSHFAGWLNYFEIANYFRTSINDKGLISAGVVPYDNLKQVDNEAMSFGIENVGVGFSQLAPIILLCLSAEIDDTVIIEQPELHIHPEIQRKLGDFFMSMSQHINLIIETHSDHLINRLRVNVADEEYDFSSHNLAITFAEKINGSTHYRKAKLNEHGSYDMGDYPKGFFNQATKDTLRMINLRAKNKK